MRFFSIVLGIGARACLIQSCVATYAIPWKASEEALFALVISQCYVPQSSQFPTVEDLTDPGSINHPC